MNNPKSVALIVGSIGIVGGTLASLLTKNGWTVDGLARKPGFIDGLMPIPANLLDLSSLNAALKDVAPSRKSFVSSRRAAELLFSSTAGTD